VTRIKSNEVTILRGVERGNRSKKGIVYPANDQWHPDMSCVLPGRWAGGHLGGSDPPLNYLPPPRNDHVGHRFGQGGDHAIRGDGKWEVAYEWVS